MIDIGYVLNNKKLTKQKKRILYRAPGIKIGRPSKAKIRIYPKQTRKPHKEKLKKKYDSYPHQQILKKKKPILLETPEFATKAQLYQKKHYYQPNKRFSFSTKIMDNEKVVKSHFQKFGKFKNVNIQFNELPVTIDTRKNKKEPEYLHTDEFRKPKIIFDDVKVLEHINGGILNVNEFVLTKKISSKVYLCYRKEERDNKMIKKKYVIKILDCSKINNFDELRITKRLGHSNIIKCHQILFYFPLNEEEEERNISSKADKVRKIFIVSEYLRPLNKVIAKDFKRLPENKRMELIRLYFKDLMTGIAYLHHNNICHRNIKPENLYVSTYLSNIDEGNRTSILKISGFGQSRIFKDEDSFDDISGTPYFLDPYIIELKNKTMYGKKADIWSAACSLFEMVFDRMPFNGKTLTQLYSAIKNKDLKFPLNIDHNLFLLFQNCFKKDPRERCDAISTLENNWVNGKNDEFRDLDVNLNFIVE